MRRPRTRLALLATLAALTATGVLAASATAASGSAAIIDCNAHGKLTHHYSVAELRAALAHMPVDVAEYTDCMDVIRNQMLAELKTNSSADGNSKSSGGGFFSTGVIIVLVIVVLGGVGFVAVAARRRAPGASR
jgi:hypothetical protein